MASRRKFLAILGGGVVVAAGGAGAFVSTRRPDAALAPWEAAGGYGDLRLNALSYAILAPNPHNRQPWVVELVGDDGLILHRDKERDLPETDPFARQLTIGLGCFLEQMRIAASATGVGVDLDVFPEGEDGPVAFARFGGAAEADPLFSAVMDRRSCKEVFEDRPVEAEKANALAELANVVTDPGEVAALQDLTWEAFKVEYLTPRTLKESVDLFRIGKAEINANPDGIDLGGAFFEGMAMAGLFTRETAMDPNSVSFAEGLRMYEPMLYSTPAWAVITTPGNSRADQIEAGRRWLRLNLTTTSLGLALHPTSQALQEYPEMAEHYAKVHEMLADQGHTVQMLGRLGYGPTVDQTPRWPLETRLANG